MTLFRSISAAVIIGLMMLACSQKELQLADQVAFELSLDERCAQFQAAKDRAHRRLAEIPKTDRDRLKLINQLGGPICELSIDDMTAEVDAMVRRLP
jgi:competence protein ComGF